MKYPRVVGLAAPLLLHAAVADAAGSFPAPEDFGAAEVVSVLSGPGALAMVGAGVVAAGVVYLRSRDWAQALTMLAALAIGGALCSQIPVATAFFFNS